MNWYDFLLRNRSEVFERSVEHIGLVAASMAIALGDRVTSRNCSGSAAHSTALGAGSGEHRANDTESGPVWIFDSGAVDRRSGREHCNRGAGFIRVAANSAEHVHRDCGSRSGSRRVRARYGDDFPASAVASATSFSRSCNAGGNSRRDRDFYRRYNHCGGDRRGGPGSVHFSRGCHGQ